MDPRSHRRPSHTARHKDDRNRSAPQDRDPKYPPPPDPRERQWAPQDPRGYYTSPPDRRAYTPIPYSTPGYASDRPEHYRPQSRQAYDYPPQGYWDYRDGSGYYDHDYYSRQYGHPDAGRWTPQESWRTDPYQQRRYEQEQPTYTEEYRYSQQHDGFQHQQSDYVDQSTGENGDASACYPGTLASSKTSGLSSSSYELSQYIDGAEQSDAGPQSVDPISDTDHVVTATQQVTAPLKYAVPHAVVSFGPAGQLIRVNPGFSTRDNAGRLEIHSLEVILGETQEQQEMRTFPGPLAREDLHKVDAIEFAHQRAAACMEDVQLPDHSSAALLWNLLILLCRQNGRIVGSDIAELLVQDPGSLGNVHSEAPTLIDLRDSPTPETSPCYAGHDDLLTGHLTSSGPETSDPQALQSYTKLLLAGRKKEALEAAMASGLWGHALFLASKMDNRSYTTVLNRFTGQITVSDPLQTLFQLLSGRTPTAATCSGSDKWGDWKPHLAVMLSNETGDPSVQQNAIVTMGDTLASKGLRHAAHVCYLTADTPFGAFTQKAERLVLLTSSQSLPFMEFAKNSAIQCTELFEYCRTLGDKSFSVPSFQVYKFLYACRLLDCGLASQAFHYCEVVGQAILRQREPSLVLTGEVIKLSERLRQAEGQLHGVGHDPGRDPEWLQQLRARHPGVQMGSYGCIDAHRSPADGSALAHGENRLYPESDVDDLRADVQSPKAELLYYRGPEEEAEDHLLHDAGGKGEEMMTSSSWDASGAQNWRQQASCPPPPPLQQQQQLPAYSPPAPLVAGSQDYSPQVQTAPSYPPLDPAREGGEASCGVGMVGMMGIQLSDTPEVHYGHGGPSQHMPPQGEEASVQPVQNTKGGWFSGWFKSKPTDVQSEHSEAVSPAATKPPPTSGFSPPPPSTSGFGPPPPPTSGFGPPPPPTSGFSPPPPHTMGSSFPSQPPSSAGINPFSRKAGQQLG